MQRRYLWITLDITRDESVPKNNREQAKNRLFSLKNPKNSTKD